MIRRLFLSFFMIIFFLIAVGSTYTSKGNVSAFKTVSENQNSFERTYVGTIGQNLEVVFYLKMKEGKVSGFYFYQGKGVNISLSGTFNGIDFMLFELNENGQKRAEIIAKQFGKEITGSWKNSSTGKVFKLNLTETKKIIPPFPKDLEGHYINSEETRCYFKLSIFRKKADYFYGIETAKRKLSGKLNLSRDLEDQMVYVTFEGIEWAEDLGTLDENNEPLYKHDVLPIGIGGVLDGNKIRIQNSGNAMNYYTKFGDCNDKFISLEKQQ